MRLRFFIFYLFLYIKIISQTDTLYLDNFQEDTISDTGKVVIATELHRISFTGKVIYNFHNRKKNGVSIYYWPNGTKYRMMTYKNGKRDGEEYYWTVEGKNERQFIYKNGILKHSISFYFPSGLKEREVKDSAGAECIYSWNLNEKLEALTLNYTDSIVRFHYYSNGNIKDKNVYIIYGKMNYAKLWDKNGKLLKKKEYMSK